MPITRATVVQQRPSTLSADVGGELVLMSVENGKYYGLDALGADVWNRLAQPIAVGELCDALIRDYDGEASRIEGDVLTLLERLTEQELLVPANP